MDKIISISSNQHSNFRNLKHYWMIHVELPSFVEEMDEKDKILEKVCIGRYVHFIAFTSN